MPRKPPTDANAIPGREIGRARTTVLTRLRIRRSRIPDTIPGRIKTEQAQTTDARTQTIVTAIAAASSRPKLKRKTVVEQAGTAIRNRTRMGTSRAQIATTEIEETGMIVEEAETATADVAATTRTIEGRRVDQTIAATADTREIGTVTKARIAAIATTAATEATGGIEATGANEMTAARTTTAIAAGTATGARRTTDETTEAAKRNVRKSMKAAPSTWPSTIRTKRIWMA